MSDIISFLSGNVPGGIGLYLAFLLVLFTVLYSISRGNDLFTPSLFKKWFAGIWLVVTLIYMAFWYSDPPPAVFSRYTTSFSAENSTNNWLAYYFRDELDGLMEANTSATDYFFRERWNYLADSDYASPENRAEQRRIANTLPVDKFLSGVVFVESGHYMLRLEVIENPSEKVIDKTTLTFPENAPEKAILDLYNWAKKYLPLKEQRFLSEPASKKMVLGKDAFYRGEYLKSRDLFARVLQEQPDNEDAQKWYQYSEIRYAGVLKPSEKADPHQIKKTTWQRMLDGARRKLLPIVKTNYERNIEDPMLSNMIAESFLLDDFNSDAEEFLKIAFGEDPFFLEVLENLSLLHQSRYAGLPFQDEDDLLRRILNITPYNVKILERYLGKLLLNVQITDSEAEEIRMRIERALIIKPNSVPVLSLQGEYALLRFAYEDALLHYQKVDELAPNDALTQYNLGVTHFKLKDEATAEKYFQNAVKYADYLDAHLYLGVIYKNRGEYEKALERFRYRVANKTGPDDYYAIQAMKGTRECLKALNIPIPTQ